MTEQGTTTVDVRGRPVRVARAGKGLPLVVLADLVGPQGWAPYLDALAARFDVILPEHPGYGGSPVPDWLDRVSDLANFYLDFLDALNLRGVHLAGFGIGGWIAADLASRNSARLASLTLVAAAGLRVRDVPQADIFLGGDDDVMRLLVHDAKLAEKLIAETLTPDGEDVRLHNQEVLARVAWDPRLHDPQLQKWTHRITTPAHVIGGADDRLVPPAYVEAWRAALPGSRCDMIAACGHLPQYEKPGELVDSIIGFVARHGSAA